MLDYASADARDPGTGGVADDLAALLRAARPGVVYTHNPADAHDTHVAVALRTIDAIRRLPADDRPGRVYGCEVWRDLDWLTDAAKVRLADDRDERHLVAMLRMYESQIVAKRFDVAAAGRRRAHATFAHSHRTDEHEQMTLAMDLTPLVDDAGPDPARFVADVIDSFRREVVTRIASLESRA